MRCHRALVVFVVLSFILVPAATALAHPGFPHDDPEVTFTVLPEHVTLSPSGETLPDIHVEILVAVLGTPVTGAEVKIRLFGDDNHGARFCSAGIPMSTNWIWGTEDGNGYYHFDVPPLGGVQYPYVAENDIGFHADVITSTWEYQGMTYLGEPAASPDLTGDLVVDSKDLSAFGLLLDTSNPLADFDHDGTVTLLDWSLFGLSFGTTCP